MLEMATLDHGPTICRKDSRCSFSIPRSNAPCFYSHFLMPDVRGGVGVLTSLIRVFYNNFLIIIGGNQLSNQLAILSKCKI